MNRNMINGDDAYKFRICNPAPLPELLESKGGRLSGIFARQIISYLEMVERLYNASVTFDDSYPGWGSPIAGTEMYDGCLGQLQRGEADFIANGLDYPLDIVNVSQGFIAFDEKISFLGVFRRPAVVKSADFSRSFYAFHWSVYLLIAAYLVMFAVIFKVRMKVMTLAKTKFGAKNQEKVRRKVAHHFKHLSIVDVIRYFLRSISVEPNTVSFCILALSIGLFSFFFFAHFNSLLNTDRVITEKARIFESYAQIMNNGIQPIFFDSTSYYRDLKNAKKGSKGKNFWDWAVKEFEEKNLLTPFSLDYLGFYVAEELKGKILIFVGEIIAKFLKSSICDLLDRSTPKLEFVLSQFVTDGFDIDDQLLEDLQVYIRTDDSAVSMIKSIVIGKELLESAKYFAIAKQFFERGFEHGHFQANMKLFERTKLITALPGASNFLGGPMPEKLKIKYRCKMYNVPDPKIPQIDHLKLSNFKVSFVFCLVLSSLSFLLLLVEISLFNKSKMVPRKLTHSSHDLPIRRSRVNYYSFESTHYYKRNN